MTEEAVALWGAVAPWKIILKINPIFLHVKDTDSIPVAARSKA